MIPAIFFKSKTRLVEAGEHRIYIFQRNHFRCKEYFYGIWIGTLQNPKSESHHTTRRHANTNLHSIALSHNTMHVALYSTLQIPTSQDVLARRRIVQSCVYVKLC